MSAIEIRYFVDGQELRPGMAVVIRQVNKAGDVVAERHATLCEIAAAGSHGAVKVLGIDYGEGPAKELGALVGKVDIELVREPQV